MTKTPNEYIEENSKVPVDAGFYGFQGGHIRQEPRRIAPFTPYSFAEMPEGTSLLESIAQGEERYYGMCYSQADAQNQARTYGWDSMGFDETPVIFKVYWYHLPPSDFMVDSKEEGNWRQLHTVDTSPADAIIYHKGEKVRSWE